MGDRYRKGRLRGPSMPFILRGDRLVPRLRFPTCPMERECRACDSAILIIGNRLSRYRDSHLNREKGVPKLAIPPGGTFDYQVVMKRDAVIQNRWCGEGRSLRDGSISHGLFGKSPKFELEHGLLSLSDTESKRSGWTKRLYKRQNPYERTSFEVGGAPSAVIHQGDQLFFHRFGTGDYGLTIMRDELLVLAIGSCVGLNLGGSIQVQEDERIAELGLYELAKTLDKMEDLESQVIWIDVGKRNLKAQIELLERAPQCEHLIVLIKGETPRNFYDRISGKGNAECICYQPVDDRFASKDSWISYIKQLPRERPKDLHLRFRTGDERMDLCEGEEALIGSYYVRVDRIYRMDFPPGELSSLAIAKTSSGVAKSIVNESSALVLGDCRRPAPGGLGVFS